MLNTYNLDKSDRSTHVKVDAKNEQLSIKKTAPNSKIAYMKVDSKAFNLAMGDEPFLDDAIKVVKSKPFRNYSYDKLYPYAREVKKYYTHGITVFQVQKNGEDVFVEYADRECEPKLFNTKYEEMTANEAERILEQDE